MGSRLVSTVFVSAVAASALLFGGVAEASGSSFPGCPTLREGMRGSCVTTLNSLLMKVNRGYGLNPRSSYFGRATRVAVLDFQGRRRLGADGQVGPITARALQAAAGRSAPAPAPAPAPRCPAAGTHTPVTIPCR